MHARDRNTAVRHALNAVLVFAGLSVGVFVLPYLFPPSSRILSASMLAGFNNSLAYVWYVAGLALAACVALRSIGATWAPLSPERSRRMFGAPPRTVVVIVAAHVVLFAALYLRKRGFVFAEGLYFQDAAYRVQAGAVPFVDFTFFYGPLMLYPTVWLAAFLDLQTAYAVYYVAAYVGGLYLLYVVLASLLDHDHDAVMWFGLFAVGFFNPITGLNYTFGRFLLPLVALLAAWRFCEHATVRGWLASVSLVALALLCSPDIGVVTLLGVSGLCVLAALRAATSRTWTARYFAAFGIPATGAALSCLLLLSIDGTFRPLAAYLRPIVTFSAGGWNTPIDPSLPVFGLLGFTLLVMRWLFLTCRDHGYQRAVAGGFALIAILMQRASFGKADVVHLAYSGLPVFLLAAAWAGAPARAARARLGVVAIMLVTIVLPLQFYHAMLFAPSAIARFAGQVAQPRSGVPPSPAPGKEAIQASLAKAVQHFGPERLFYMHRLEYYRLPVYLRFRIKPFLYYPLLAAAFTPEDIRDVIRSLQDSHAIVLVLRSDLNMAEPRPLQTHWWHYVTSSPVAGSEVFNLTLEFQARLEAPLVRFLNSAYERRFEDGEILGLVLRGDPPTPRDALQ